jgi:ADP-ribose pyrophosphatase
MARLATRRSGGPWAPGSIHRTDGPSMTKVVDFEIEGDSIAGAEGGFLAVRRLRLHNLRADGSRSRSYVCDFLVRKKGIDAVVVAVYHRQGDGVQVLLREGLRPVLANGRDAGALSIPDPQPYLTFTEVVAGIIEVDDRGEEGVRRRAAIEVEEESGFAVEPDAVQFLGAGSFPSPGSMPEKFWLTAVEVTGPGEQRHAAGDGSPMEEGATTHWMDLDDAIAACVDGRIEDAKTEIVLRRLRERLT